MCHVDVDVACMQHSVIVLKILLLVFKLGLLKILLLVFKLGFCLMISELFLSISGMRTLRGRPVSSSV